MLNNSPNIRGAFVCAHACIIWFSAHGRYRDDIDAKSYCI